jgi:hypothetical protein
MIPTEKQQVFEKHFTSLEDKGTYLACVKGDHPRIWMYDKKLINLFSHEKLETLIVNQINHA